MHSVDCDTLVQNDCADAWVLAVLADFRGRQPRSVIHEILTRIIRRFQDPPSVLREYVSMLEMLSNNRDLNLSIREAFDRLAINLEPLPSFQQGTLKGKMEGKAEGAQEQALAIARKLLNRRGSPPSPA